jgi:CheY-like chemotaxis protein
MLPCESGRKPLLELAVIGDRCQHIALAAQLLTKMSMPTERVVCPRCENAVRSLGNAGSQLMWYTCGTCNHVWAAGIPPKATPPAPVERGSDSRQHVLVVDDDTLTLSLVERTLTDYRISTARDGWEALLVLSTSDPVDLLITDYMMPEMTGRELVSRARVARPDLRVLVVTGHGETLVKAEPAWWAAEPHVEKPFHVAALRQAVEELIGPPRNSGA